MSVIALAAMAQNTVITPYSRYGYGILSDNASSMQRSMGGVGYAMNSGRQINVMNPASYAARQYRAACSAFSLSPPNHAAVI